MQELLNQQRACITLQVVIAFQCGLTPLLFVLLAFVLRFLDIFNCFEMPFNILYYCLMPFHVFNNVLMPVDTL